MQHKFLKLLGLFLLFISPGISKDNKCTNQNTCRASARPIEAKDSAEIEEVPMLMAPGNCMFF